MPIYICFTTWATVWFLVFGIIIKGDNSSYFLSQLAWVAIYMTYTLQSPKIHNIEWYKKVERNYNCVVWFNAWTFQQTTGKMQSQQIMPQDHLDPNIHCDF